MNAITLLEACEAVYGNAQLVAGDGRDGASVTTTEDGDTILAFRGTLTGKDATSIKDWLNDFHADPIRVRGLPGRVHAGFYSSACNLWPVVLAALDADQRKGKLWITGHSKGGAVAVLAAAMLADWQPKLATFASPRVGDLEFASQFPALSYARYENEMDLVPMLPPFVYRACGTRMTNGTTPAHIRDLAVGRLIADENWEQIVSNHGLETGYRPWIESYDGTRKAA